MVDMINIKTPIGLFFDDFSIGSSLSSARVMEIKKFFDKNEIHTLEDILKYNKKQLQPMGKRTVYQLEKTLLKYDLTLMGRKLPVKPITAKQYRLALAHMLFKYDDHDPAYFHLMNNDTMQQYLRAADNYVKENIL